MKALVLEGGGMRGTYTAGVLDSFIDYDVEFDYVIGTSAGATSGISYVSKQKGRTRFSNTDLLRLHDYLGWKSLIFGGGIIDLHYLFDIYPDRHYPFDFETYKRSKTRVVAVATDANTGKAVYLEEKNDFPRFLECCRASCSLPLVCPMAWVDGKPMVDGGVADSIPIQQAINEGADDITVILTKPKGYRKPDKPSKLPWPIYRKYPQLRKALINRNIDYNKQIAMMERLEEEGKIKVLRPSNDCGVGRTTKDISALEKLYDLGYKEGSQLVKKFFA